MKGKFKDKQIVSEAHIDLTGLKFAS